MTMPAQDLPEDIDNASEMDGWMPLEIGQHLSATMNLSTEQHGAYLLLCFYYWNHGTLPNDDKLLARISRLRPAKWRAHRPVLAGLFLVDDTSWTHEWLAQERSLLTMLNQMKIVQPKRGSRKAKSPSTPEPEVLSPELEKDLSHLPIM